MGCHKPGNRRLLVSLIQGHSPIPGASAPGPDGAGDASTRPDCVTTSGAAIRSPK